MKKIRKAVIPVAGMGTRFLPVTKVVAKELFPIVDIPAIHYIVKEAIMSGIEEILFVTNFRKKAIERYFSHDFVLEDFLKEHGKTSQIRDLNELLIHCKFSFINQEEPLGTGHAIALSRDFVKDEPFAVLYGDDLFDSNVPVLRQMIDIYEQYDCNVIGVNEVSEKQVSFYGICEMDEVDPMVIVDIVEKPSVSLAPSRMAGLGRYILKPDIFTALDLISPVNGEYLLTDAMKLLMSQKSFRYCLIDGCYYDIGSQEGYVKANLAYAMKREELRSAFLENCKVKE